MSENRQTLMLLVWLSTFLILLFVSFIVMIILLYQNKHAKHKQQIQEIRSSFENTLLASQIEIQEMTFQNISREIHDNIGLSLTLSKLNLTTLSQIEIDERIRHKINSSINFISTAIEDLRNISRSLNSDSISRDGFLHALEEEITTINKTGITIVNLDVIGTEKFFSGKTELVLFRIVQEAIGNALKHSNAKEINIKIEFLEPTVEITISDNGSGFNTENIVSTKGSGLFNMSARTKLINGSFNIKSDTNGTLISITIPI